MTCKGAAAFPEKCSAWSSGLAPRDPTQDLPEWPRCVGCGEGRVKQRQAGNGDSAMHREGEGVADEATEHCLDGKAARVTLRLMGLWKQVCLV